MARLRQCGILERGMEAASLPRLGPELSGNWAGIDAKIVPPGSFVTRVMERAMMCAAQRDSELVADFTPEGPRLGKAKVMGIRGRSPADQARLRADELQMPLISPARGFRDCERDIDIMADCTAVMTV